ncbi:hypothetical protein APHNP_0048 [Anaplasma phagocytophilum str. ApNP]|uniref:Uncharacterized protein n=2 Tax=Anaplasma phagocytophilum TaxID=948 RepID=A0A0F3NJB8_ANAPH|nr:hypothetical protein APHNP_0048 [Anaplasma phagocytophilum str. ApNP]
MRMLHAISDISGEGIGLRPINRDRVERCVFYFLWEKKHRISLKTISCCF